MALKVIKNTRPQGTAPAVPASRGRIPRTSTTTAKKTRGGGSCDVERVADTGPVEGGFKAVELVVAVVEGELVGNVLGGGGDVRRPGRARGRRPVEGQTRREALWRSRQEPSVSRRSSWTRSKPGVRSRAWDGLDRSFLSRASEGLGRCAQGLRCGLWCSCLFVRAAGGTSRVPAQLLVGLRLRATLMATHSVRDQVTATPRSINA